MHASPPLPQMEVPIQLMLLKLPHLLERVVLCCCPPALLLLLPTPPRGLAGATKHGCAAVLIHVPLIWVGAIKAILPLGSRSSRAGSGRRQRF